jgi:hypothetical protein
VFDKTFDRKMPHFEIIRGAYLLVHQLRDMRADRVRPDYIVNTIETGKSFCAAHRSSLTGPAAAVPGRSASPRAEVADVERNLF